MSIIAKNTTGSEIVICGQGIAASGQYTVQATDLACWASSDLLITKIGSGDIVINDGVKDLGESAAVDHIKNFSQKFETDADDRPIMRGATAKKGWHYQPHWMEVKLGEYGQSNGIYNKDVSETDLGYTTYKIYDNTDTEITSDANKLNAVKTVVTWEPTEDYEIIASKIFQASAPSNDVRIWVEGLPDVPYASGGSRFFGEGGINLKLLGDGAAADTDGRSSKFLQYNATYHTNKFEITVRHNTGETHAFAILWELYLA